MRASAQRVADVDPPPRYFLHAEEKSSRRSSDDRETRESSWPSLRLFLTGLIVVFGGSFHFGFQISIINPMAEVLNEFIVDSFFNRLGLDINGILWKIIWPTIAGILFIGCALGAFAATQLVEKFGCKFALLASSMILSTSFLLTVGSKLFSMAELFIGARLLCGIGIGMVTTASGVYLTEIASLKQRGFMGVMIGFATNIGFVCASALGLPQLLGHPDRWHFAFLAEVVPCAILFLSTLFLFHESPFFLLRAKKRSSAAESIMAHRKGTVDPFEVQRILCAMELEIVESSESHQAGWVDLIRHRGTRWALVLAVSINVTVSFSGITAVSFFGTFLLTAIGFTEHGAAFANFLASFSGTAGAILSILVVDKIGRRGLLIGSLAALSVINLVIMVNTIIYLYYDVLFTGYIFLGLLVVFLFVFSFGVGPLAWFLSTELTHHRTKMQSIGVSAQYLSCFLSPLCFYPLQNLCGPLSFLIFIAPPALTGVFLYYKLPETRDRPTDEIVRELEGTFYNSRTAEGDKFPTLDG